MSMLMLPSDSTVVCSCFRLYASVVYFHSADSTYTIARLSLWALADMTCTFLVSCMPSAPKVFKDSKWIRKVLDILKSWTRLSVKGSRNDSASSWPGSSTHAFEPRNVYRHLRENDGLPLQTFPSATSHNGDQLELSILPRH